jgi:hypothetical protein
VTEHTDLTPEEDLCTLHNGISEVLNARIKSPECTTADIRAAIEWAKVNGMSGVATKKNALGQLMGSITDIDQAFIDSLTQ